MTTKIEPITSENISIGNSIDQKNAQVAIQNAIPINQPGVIQTTTEKITTTTNNIPTNVLVTDIKNNIGNNTGNVVISNNNIDGNNLGAQKTTTVTTTHYGVNPIELTTSANNYQLGQGQIIGIGGDQDNALDINYMNNLGNNIVLGDNNQALGQATTTTITTVKKEEMPYELGQFETRTEDGGLLMGVGGGIHDNARDITYSSNTHGLTSVIANNSITTQTLLQNQPVIGKVEEEPIQGHILQGEVPGLTTTTTTTTETNFIDGINIAEGARKSVDISKIAINKTINEGVDVKSLEIYNKTTLLQDKVQHIIKREIQPIIKTIIKPIIQKEIQPIVQREIQPIIQKEFQPIVQKEIQPIIQKEIQPVVKKEIQPIIQREVQPIVKKEIQPILFREEQHINKREVVPKVERQEQKQVRTKIVAYIMKEVKHTTQKKVIPKTETQVQNQEKLQIVPYIMKEVQHVNKNRSRK